MRHRWFGLAWPMASPIGFIAFQKIRRLRGSICRFRSIPSTCRATATSRLQAATTTISQKSTLRTKDGAIRQLSHLQQGWDGVPLASTTIFHTRSFDGTDIEAALMKPQGAPPAGKWPLVMIVHGGPSSHFMARYGWEEAWAQMLVVERLRSVARQSARLRRLQREIRRSQSRRLGWRRLQGSDGGSRCGDRER